LRKAILGKPEDREKEARDVEHRQMGAARKPGAENCGLKKPATDNKYSLSCGEGGRQIFAKKNKNVRILQERCAQNSPMTSPRVLRGRGDRSDLRTRGRARTANLLHVHGGCGPIPRKAVARPGADRGEREGRKRVRGRQFLDGLQDSAGGLSKKGRPG